MTVMIGEIMSDLKTEFKHIYFEKIEQKPKTSVWICMNKNYQHELGTVEYYAAWRQYVFCPYDETQFSGGCLNDVEVFMKELRAHELETRKK